MYPCTLIDPPWPEYGGGKSVRGAQKYYALLSPRAIYGVIVDCPIWKPAASAHLWCWITNNKLKDGLWLMEQLGFRYVTNWVWVKGEGGELQNPGLGQYSRGLHELLLFGVRGSTMRPAPSKRPPTVIIAPRREHSRKPDEQYDVIEKVSPGPRAELFARAKREGWDVWGDQSAAF